MLLVSCSFVEGVVCLGLGVVGVGGEGIVVHNAVDGVF